MTNHEKYVAVAAKVGYFVGEARPNTKMIRGLRNYGMRLKDAHLFVAMLARIDKVAQPNTSVAKVLDSLKVRIEGWDNA